MLKVCLIGMLCFLSCSCSVMKIWPDSPAEEWIEAVIEDATGLDIDLTSEDSQKR